MGPRKGACGFLFLSPKRSAVFFPAFFESIIPFAECIRLMESSFFSLKTYVQKFALALLTQPKKCYIFIIAI
jgi:hypothetical protein